MPPFSRPEIGKIDHPFAVGGRGVKLAIEHIRRDRTGRPCADLDGRSLEHLNLTPSEFVAQRRGKQTVEEAVYSG